MSDTEPRHTRILGRTARRCAVHRPASGQARAPDKMVRALYRNAPARGAGRRVAPAGNVRPRCYRIGIMRYTRRQIGQMALGALPAAGLLRPHRADAGDGGHARARIRRYAGVQVGMNVPYNFGNNNMPGDEVLSRCLDAWRERHRTRSQPVELAMGWTPPAPAARAGGGSGRRRAGCGSGAGRPTSRGRGRSARSTRTRASRFEILKFDGIYAFDDPEMDYAFTLAKTLGARAISCEIDAEGTDARRPVRRQAPAHGRLPRACGNQARSTGRRRSR